MKTKHTQGQWEITGQSESGRYITIKGDNRTVARVPWCPDPVGNEIDDRDNYDAKLIAAAPELLEALISIENDDESIPEAIWTMRNDAIKKATE